jgi:hypothetical protein
VQYVTVQPGQVMFTPGQALNLTGTNPWIAPDTNPKLEQRHAPAASIVEAVDSNQSFVNLATAHVSYAGVATIDVKVNGVTGSAVVVVQQPFTVTAPALFVRGTTQSFSLALADWWANLAVPGTDILATMPYINGASGKITQKVSLYCATLPLEAGKTVAYVTLPDVSTGVVDGVNAMHIFAVTAGTPAT